MQDVKPLIYHLEYSFILVGFADVANDVVTIRAVDSQHLCGIIFILHLLENLLINNLTELCFPTALVFMDYSSYCDTDDNEELLMDVEHEILQVGINTCLIVNCCLFIR